MSQIMAKNMLRPERMILATCFIGMLMSCVVEVQANSPPSFDEIPGTNPQSYYDMDKERIKENQETNVVIYTLRASDLDGDCITFDIKPGFGDEFFELADQTCTQANVSLTHNLDYETATSHDVTWLLSDGTNSAVETDITVYVLDVNDNEPMFIGLPYVALVPEDYPLHTPLYRISVEDNDAANNDGTITMYENNVTSRTFDIIDYGNWSADVVLLNNLDYETFSGYFLLDIVAVDNGVDPGPLSAYTTLTVYVSDVQDEPPSWIGQPYVGTAYNGTEVGTTLVTVNARDGDKTRHNEIQYFLTNESANSDLGAFFDVKQFSGEVYLTTSLVSELHGHHNITVLAVENDVNQDLEFRTSSTLVYIRIYMDSQETETVENVIAVTWVASVGIFCILVFFVIALCYREGSHDFKRSNKVAPI